MKKLLTLVAAVLMAVGAMAQTTITDFEQTSFTSFGWKSSVVNETFNADGTVTLTNETCRTNNYDYQYWINGGITLTKGETYTVTLEAKFDGEWKGVEDNTLVCKLGDWDNGETKYLNPTTDGVYHTISAQFIAGTASNGILLQHGHFVGTVTWKSIKITHEESSANHVLKVSTTEAKSNSWDSQITVTLPTALEKNKNYTLNMKVKGGNKLIGQQGTYGWEALQPVFSDDTNPNYCSHFCLSEEWTSVCSSDGGSIQTDGKNAYTTLTFNLGTLNGDMYIDDLTITDADGNVAYSNDFESGYGGVSKVSWQSHVTISRVEEVVPATAPTTQIVTISDAGYRTFAVATPGISLPDGLKAYGAKVNESKTSVVLTEMTTVPAYHVAVLQGEPGAYLCVKNAAWADVSAINDLKFEWGEKTIAEGDNIYVLAQEGGSVVFAPASAGKLPACKGYLVIEGVSGAKSLPITFDDVTTGVDNVVVNDNASIGVAYNLAGQRVNANAKGIVIINGKKFMNK